MSNEQKKRAWDYYDGIRERLVKAIPSETVGLFIAGTAMINALEGDLQTVFAWVWLVLCTAFTPVYLYFYPVRDVVQLVMTTIAVPVWAMTIVGSAWTSIPNWQEPIGAIVVLVYSGVAVPIVGWATKEARKPS